MRGLFLLIFFSACSPAPDFVVKGLVVFANGYDVDPATVEHVIELVEDGVAEHYAPWNAESSFSRHGAELEYVDAIDGLPESVAGVQLGPFLKVKGEDCWTRYKVLGHEILHFVAQFHLNFPPEINATHLVPHFFGVWADEVGQPFEDTVEVKVFRNIAKSVCGY